LAKKSHVSNRYNLVMRQLEIITITANVNDQNDIQTAVAVL